MEIDIAWCVLHPDTKTSLIISFTFRQIYPRRKGHIACWIKQVWAIWKREKSFVMLASLNYVSVFPCPNHYTDCHIPGCGQIQELVTKKMLKFLHCMSNCSFTISRVYCVSFTVLNINVENKLHYLLSFSSGCCTEKFARGLWNIFLSPFQNPQNLTTPKADLKSFL
jgi:hypothetical protein